MALSATLMRRGAAAHPERPAVWFGDQSLTFHEVNTRANLVARHLGVHGINKGEHIALLVNNGINSMPMEFAAIKAGLVRVPLNARMSLDEHTTMLTQARATALVADETLMDRAVELSGRVEGLRAGGYNVYPREVEDALSSHPAVAECAVVSAPDDTWVEAVTAVVTVVPDTSVTEDDLIQHVRSRLAHHRAPKSVHFIDAIPKSAVGKILRRDLRDQLWEGKR